MHTLPEIRCKGQASASIETRECGWSAGVGRTGILDGHRGNITVRSAKRQRGAETAAAASGQSDSAYGFALVSAAIPVDRETLNAGIRRSQRHCCRCSGAAAA